MLYEVMKRSTKHSGVIALFDQHFVRKGLLPQEMSRWLHRAFDIRQIGDYRELMLPTGEQVEEILQTAEEFIAKVEAYLTSKLENQS